MEGAAMHLSFKALLPTEARYRLIQSRRQRDRCSVTGRRPWDLAAKGLTLELD